MKTCLVLIFLSILYRLCWSGGVIATNERDYPRQFYYHIRQDKAATMPDKPYSWLTFTKATDLPASWGVKSVLFNTAGTKLYALNLEGMSIYEYSRENKKLLRIISFRPTKAKGWDYVLNKPIPVSFAEKPVEGCFSHQDKILWVSLHNAGGIVPILLDAVLIEGSRDSMAYSRAVYVKDVETNKTDTQYTALIKTGMIPKVIAKTDDDQTLLVSNWGSKTLSILKINDTLYPYGKRFYTIKMPDIPRGVAIDEKNKRSFVAIYGSNKISVIRNKNWKMERNLAVPFNPRHLLLDTSGRLFVSFSALSQIACIQPATGKLLFKAATHKQPRTIALSKNQKFLFVTCYEGNTLDVFKINQNSFSRIFSIKCTGKPVGVSLYEDQEMLEAWVCNYMAGNIKVLQFTKE